VQLVAQPVAALALYRKAMLKLADHLAQLADRQRPS